MKIIYHCYGSAHSSIVASAIHLGKLPINRKPSTKEILSLPDFDVAMNDSIGHIFYKGKDEWGNEVYTMGMGRETELVKRSLKTMIKIYDENLENQFFFVLALPSINRLAKFGGALSRRYGFVRIGRKLAVKGIIQSYENLTNLVEKTKKELMFRSRYK